MDMFVIMHNDFPTEACFPGTTEAEAEARAAALTAAYHDMLLRSATRPEGQMTRARHRVVQVPAYDPSIARGRACYERSRDRVTGGGPSPSYPEWEDLTQTARDHWIGSQREAMLRGMP